MAKLQEMVRFMQTYLRHAEIQDYPGAWNGLQVENSGVIRRIVAAVDACEAVINSAAKEKGTLLLVHHGLFWGGVQPVCGAVYRKMKAALSNDLAVYSSHLPLDLHPKIGNNVLLCQALGLKKLQPFLFSKGQSIGWKADANVTRNELHKRLEKAVGGTVHLAPGGGDRIRKIGVCSGGSGGEVAHALSEGVDTFICGEGPHHSFTLAEELGINLFYAGHYNTETFGVKALATLVSKKFQLPWAFVDHPTGL